MTKESKTELPKSVRLIIDCQRTTIPKGQEPYEDYMYVMLNEATDDISYERTARELLFIDSFGHYMMKRVLVLRIVSDNLLLIENLYSPFENNLIGSVLTVKDLWLEEVDSLRNDLNKGLYNEYIASVLNNFSTNPTNNPLERF